MHIRQTFDTLIRPLSVTSDHNESTSTLINDILLTLVSTAESDLDCRSWESDMTQALA